MRKLIVCLGLVVVAAIAPGRAAAHHTPGHTQAQLNQTRAQLQSLRAFVHNCLAWSVLPIARYGNPEAGTGYRYDFGAEDGLTTGFDLPEQPADTNFIVPQIRQTPACVRAVSRRAMAFAPPTGERAHLARKAVRIG